MLGFTMIFIIITFTYKSSKEIQAKPRNTLNLSKRDLINADTRAVQSAPS
jgi:hypothetical protein